MNKHELFRHKLAPYKAEHLDAMRVREHEVLALGLDKLYATCEVSECITFFDRDDPVAVLGSLHLWDGCAEVFIIPSTELTGCLWKLLRCAKFFLEMLFRDRGYRRLQTASLADGKTDKFMRHLGFTCEGTMVGYSSTGQDYRMWRRMANGD